MKTLSKLGKYNKSLVAIVGVVLTGLNVSYGNNPKVQAVIAVATLLGVYGVKNKATE